MTEPFNPDNDVHLTDLGNMHRLVRCYGKSMRFVAPWGKWFTWDGTRWAEDRTGVVHRMAKDIPRQMHRDALQMGDRSHAADLSKHAFRSESEPRVKAMASLARSELEVATTPEVLDADPWLFNVANGTLVLRTGELRPHDQKDLITKLAPVEFDPHASAPQFEAFLSRVLDGRQDLIDFVQRLFGYAMVGVTTEDTLALFHGLGANGKTTLLNTMLALFGDYGQQAEPALLLKKRSDAHPTGLADLKGARLVVTSEIAAGRALDEALVKSLTGGDRIRARRMHQNFFEFDPTHTLILATNHQPLIRGTDHAIWRRINLVPFDVTIPPEEQDPELSERLKAELPGILNWALQGCLAWQEMGLAPPSEVVAATTSYRDDMDTLAGFLDEHCVLEPHAEVEAKELYARYKKWAEEAGLRLLARNVFGRQLKERGFEERKHPKTRRVLYLGIRIKTGSEATRSHLDVIPSNSSHIERTDNLASGSFGDEDGLFEEGVL